MKDIHSHILYGIDDGSISFKESINILKEAYDYGFTDIVVTPHYKINNSYVCDNDDKEKILITLKEKLKEEGISINLYLGNEIMVHSDITNNIKGELIASLNDSRYILIELPINKKLKNLYTGIKELQDNNYKIIIAHPERYLKYKIKDYIKLIDMGVYFQGNMASVLGYYGKRSKKVIEKMLKKHMIHFLGSDVHHESNMIYSRIKDIVKRVYTLTNSKKITVDIVDTNIEKVLNDEDVMIYEII